MGFIEDLRKKGDSLKERKRQEEMFHRQRHELAKVMRKDSGVEDLIANFIEALRRTDPLAHSWLQDSGSLRQTLSLRQLRNPFLVYPELDIDSIVDDVEWGRWQDRSSGHKGGSVVMIDTYPDGKIVFYADKITPIAIEEWKAKNSVLEDTLEQAFHSPWRSWW